MPNGIVRAVNRMPMEIEEDRVRHRCIVIFLGEMIGVHAVWPKVTVGRIITRLSRGNSPVVEVLAVNVDAHVLRRLIDLDKDGAVWPAAPLPKCYACKQRELALLEGTAPVGKLV